MRIFENMKVQHQTDNYFLKGIFEFLNLILKNNKKKLSASIRGKIGTVCDLSVGDRYRLKFYAGDFRIENPLT